MTSTLPFAGSSSAVPAALCVPNAPPTLPFLDAGKTHDPDSGDSEQQVDPCKQVTCHALVTKETAVEGPFQLQHVGWALQPRVIPWGNPQAVKGFGCWQQKENSYHLQNSSCLNCECSQGFILLIYEESKYISDCQCQNVFNLSPSRTERKGRKGPN